MNGNRKEESYVDADQRVKSEAAAAFRAATDAYARINELAKQFTGIEEMELTITSGRSSIRSWHYDVFLVQDTQDTSLRWWAVREVGQSIDDLALYSCSVLGETVGGDQDSIARYHHRIRHPDATTPTPDIVLGCINDVVKDWADQNHQLNDYQAMCSIQDLLKGLPQADEALSFNRFDSDSMPTFPCPHCGAMIPRLQPRLACMQCGTMMHFNDVTPGWEKAE
jgi:hypothetical protein